MMQIVYFSQKEQFLTEMESRESQLEYIAPSPAKADSLRTRLPLKSGADVITIAKFTSNLISLLWAPDDLPQVKRKSELLLIFGILKNRYLPDLGFEQFTQAYNLFSDLRSFTLNEDALNSVLDEQPEVIRQAVELFWKLLDLTSYLDEHGAYQQIAEKLRSSDEHEVLKKTYIFWGFQHLNGQQVDLLKALAIRYEVIVPFPLELKEKLKKSDWPSWLKDNSVKEIFLDQKAISPSAKFVSTNSREIALSLKSFVKSGDQIILGVSKLTPQHIDIVPSGEVQFKIPHNLVAPELKKVANEIKTFSGSVDDLVNILNKKLIEQKDLKLMRALELYLEALESIKELTDENIQVDNFFLKLLREVVSLNQPRTSFVPVSAKPLTIDLKDMSSLEDIDRSRRVIFCIDERFEDIQGLGQNYTEAIQKALAALGPLKRNELELLFKQWEFRDLFSHADVTVFLNEGTLKHSLIWKRLFSDIDLLKSDYTFELKPRIVRDHFRSLAKKTYQSSFSASKLQTFIDCPRKFYFSYVDKVFPQIILEKDFDPMTAGTIIHEIIEKFFKGGLQDIELARLTKEVMGIYITEKKLQLPHEVFLQRELIFNHRAMNGIEFIRNLESKINEKIDWKIEEAFSLKEGLGLNGKIDCVGISESYLFLLDFKSTEFSASSSSEVDSYDAVQLWAYAHASESIVKDFSKKTVILGYVVLDDASKSNLLTSDEDLYRDLKDAKICRIHRFKDEFSQKLKEAQEKMLELTLSIQKETNYFALPRKGSTCDFCELSKVCVKSEVAHGPVT